MMKLNLDCMRDILLALENFDYGQLIHHSELEKMLSSIYPEADVRYSLLKLAEAGYIKAQIFDEPGFCSQVDIIFDITYAGHEFLNSIRPQSVWQKISPLIKKTGISSLHVIGEIALKLTTESFLQKLL